MHHISNSYRPNQRFNQIPLVKRSMQYCDIVTLYKGARVNTTSAMEMPVSQTDFEELMCRVFDDHLQADFV